MLTINKITSDHVVDFAAEELKKYLRMMMPEGGDVLIKYNPEAKDGFRLGLMKQFNLDASEAKDERFDDIIYMDCDEKGGIIAGNNTRSVLLCVYEYLRQNGCRWLLPGIDGEYIPLTNIKPVKMRHVYSIRYRGWATEGSISQEGFLNGIDFMPKVGMNAFLIEFKVPVGYYRSYYNHRYNEEIRNPELVTDATLLQWKRQIETEMSKRGIQFHDICHGTVADALGIDSNLRNSNGDNEKAVPEENRQYLALINGERKLNKNTPHFTNICMSNPKARRKVVEYMTEYVKNHGEIDYYLFGLADLSHNHCECENCVKKTPSDWYVILLNEIDEEFTKQNIDTKVSFLAYVDTSWAPETEVLKNQDRFALCFAPITRDYHMCLPEEGITSKVTHYETNKSPLPKTLEEYMAHMLKWQEKWHGPNMAFEYHFWRYYNWDQSSLEISKRVSEDVKVYKQYGIDGALEDGSTRCFFPTGLPFYTYARTCFDINLTPEEIAKDYFDTAFGEAGDKFYAYMQKVALALPFNYMASKGHAGYMSPEYIDPEIVKGLENFDEVLKEGEALIKEYYNMPHRLGTVSVRLLEVHHTFIKIFAQMIKSKAQGDYVKAKDLYNELRLEMGKHEIYIEKYYDQWNVFEALGTIFGQVNEDIMNLGIAEE